MINLEHRSRLWSIKVCSTCFSNPFQKEDLCIITKENAISSSMTGRPSHNSPKISWGLVTRPKRAKSLHRSWLCDTDEMGTVDNKAMVSANERVFCDSYHTPMSVPTPQTGSSKSRNPLLLFPPWDAINETCVCPVRRQWIKELKCALVNFKTVPVS